MVAMRSGSLVRTEISSPFNKMGAIFMRICCILLLLLLLLLLRSGGGGGGEMASGGFVTGGVSDPVVAVLGGLVLVVVG